MSGQGDMSSSARLSGRDKEIVDAWTAGDASISSRELNATLDKLPKYSGKVYRGLALEQSDFEKFNRGKIVALRENVSSSIDIGVARDFMTSNKDGEGLDNPWGVLLHIDVNDGAHVGDLSMYPEQKEVVVRPGKYSLTMVSISPTARTAEYRLIPRR